MAEPTQPDHPEPPPLDAESVELLSRYARGDDSALGRLVEKHADGMKRYVAAKLPGDVKRRIDASDIYQQMSLELFRIRGRFENQGPGAFRAMLRSMSDFILMRAVERERTQKRSPSRERDLSPPPGGSELGQPLDRLAAETSTPSGIASRKEHRAQLTAAFASLPEADREILRWIDEAGATYEEVAEKTGASAAALRKRHSRAIQRLKRAMGEGCDGSPSP